MPKGYVKVDVPENCGQCGRWTVIDGDYYCTAGRKDGTAIGTSSDCLFNKPIDCPILHDDAIRQAIKVLKVAKTVVHVYAAAWVEQEVSKALALLKGWCE